MNQEILKQLVHLTQWSLHQEAWELMPVTNILSMFPS